MTVNKPFIDFLLWCLETVQREGVYYGDKKHFYRRMADAVQLLTALREMFNGKTITKESRWLK